MLTKLALLVLAWVILDALARTNSPHFVSMGQTASSRARAILSPETPRRR